MEITGGVAGQVMGYMRGDLDQDSALSGNKVRSNSDSDPEWDAIPTIVSLGGWQLKSGRYSKAD